jgi:hypothetical protein
VQFCQQNSERSTCKVGKLLEQEGLHIIMPVLLSGSFVTTAWCILTLWMEEMASRCGGQLWTSNKGWSCNLVVGWCSS